MGASWPTPTPRRSRSGSCSATWRGNQPGPSARPGCWPGSGRGAIRPPVGWAAVTGAGALAGIGFIVSLLIASLAFHGSQLAEAKVGILSAAVCASALGWTVFRLTALLPKRLRARALLGTADTIIDLAVPVDAERDHVRGPDRAPVTLVEYGATSSAPTAAGAEPVVRELLADYGDLRYVWRHLRRLPTCTRTRNSRPRAPPRPRPSSQGKFWPMHDQLLQPPGRADGQGPDPVRRRARPGHRPVHPRPAQPRRTGEDRCGRGLRRPEQRLGHAHVLRQRQAAPGRLRHQHPFRCDTDGQDPDPDQLTPAATARILISPARRRRTHLGGYALSGWPHRLAGVCGCLPRPRRAGRQSRVRRRQRHRKRPARTISRSQPRPFGKNQNRHPERAQLTPPAGSSPDPQAEAGVCSRT